MDRLRGALVGFWDNHVHFLEIHYLYIGFMILLSSALYYCQPGTDWNYIDALFMATTGVTNTGLNTVSMSQLSTYQVAIMYFNSFLASHTAVSYIVLVVRKHYFSKRFEDILLFNKARRMREENKRRERQKRNDIEAGLAHNNSATSIKSQTTSNTNRRHRRFSLSSAASSPVPGVRSRHRPRSACASRSSHRSISLWMTNPAEIRNFFRDIRYEQKQAIAGREADATAAAVMVEAMGIKQPLPTSASMGSPPIHSFDNEASASIGSKSTVISDLSTVANDDMRNPAEEEEESGHRQQQQQQQQQQHQGIAFAGDVEQQREIARRQLEKERRFDELMDKIAKEVDDPFANTYLDSSDDDDNDEAFFEDIMQQPIDKSQLTRQQRYRIGGAEYRALDMLSRIVPVYYLGFVILSSFAFRIYVASSAYAQEVLLTSNPEPLNPWFFSFFLGMSAFNNLGMSPLDTSLAPFKNAPFPLILSIILILVGNTAYAILLRFIIWVLYKCTPSSQSLRRETFRYLLDYPRRCYTLLFPATQTWWLLIILLAITIAEVVCFLALDFWLPVLQDIPWASRILDGFFQSVATRNAGFSVVGIGDLNPGTQLVYIVAMYISVYPVAISMRNSNVYQERALGIYRGENEEKLSFSDNDLRGSMPFIKLQRYPTISSVVTTSRKLMIMRRPDFFVLTQIQRQLTSDICWVIAGVFCICVIESALIMAPSAVTMGTVIYECVSAFANVGGSTGYPNTATSQAGQYHTLSKFVLIVLMYRGRHRGLPSAIDRAVLLPSEQLEEQEVQDQMLKRRNTSLTNQSSNIPNLMFYSRASTL